MLWIISSVNACRQASQNLGHPVLSHTRGKTPAKCHFSAKPWQIRNFIIAYQNVVRVLSCTQHEEMLLSNKDSLLFKKNWQTCLCQQTEHHAHETRISVFFCTVSTGCTYLCLFWLHNIVMDFTRLSLTSPHVTDCTKLSWISQCCRGILHKYKDVEIKTLRELNRWSMWKANKKVAEKVEPKMQKKKHSEPQQKPPKIRPQTFMIVSGTWNCSFAGEKHVTLQSWLSKSSKLYWQWLYDKSIIYLV